MVKETHEQESELPFNLERFCGWASVEERINKYSWPVLHLGFFRGKSDEAQARNQSEINIIFYFIPCLSFTNLPYFIYDISILQKAPKRGWPWQKGNHLCPFVYCSNASTKNQHLPSTKSSIIWNWKLQEKIFWTVLIK